MRVEYNESEQKIPIKLWLDDIEDGAMQQAKNLSNLPFAFKHIAIMPDSHQGYGMPIGGVIAAENTIIPNAVGKDIACGMCAIKTPWTVDEVSIDVIKKIMSRIREEVPVGFSHHKIKQNLDLMPSIGSDMSESYKGHHISLQEYDNALTQLGTLGGGNHFIEIQKDKENNIWIMIHSGSRNIGLKVADYYDKMATSLNEQWHSGIPTKWELAFLPLDDDFGQAYLKEMQYCVEFAFANRKLMMIRIANAFDDIMKWKKVDISKMINIAHNYAEMENHFGKNVMVHRKGATLAREDTVGIIPGSQGSKSYIVKGKGNKESFNSCSHGAGRKMGRKQAQRELNLDAEKAKLDAQGIIHAIRGVKDLDEASGAYKDIDIVMKNQADLVDITVELTPLAVIKG
jgi:tRNA-splicing ligase RtcB